MSAAHSLPAGTLLAGKFRIERLLGAGAMGAVYAIEHELTHHKRALKLLHPDVQRVPEIVRRFLNEASAAGRAGSPHIVETFDAGTLPTGEPYVVMELLEGQTLGALVARERPLAIARAAELVAQAAEGIEAAHRAGIIHRDVKPENLFVTTRDGRPFVKILDFGVSKFSAASSGIRETRAGSVIGSPAYMSREQLLAQGDLDARTDVYSLGVVLFESLTGALPFDAPSLEVLTVRVLSGQHSPIETLRSDVPPALAQIVRRAMASERDARFPSARALAEALAPFRPGALRGSVPDLALAQTAFDPQPAVTTQTPLRWLGAPRRRLWALGAAVGAIVFVIAAVVLGGRLKAPRVVAPSSVQLQAPATPVVTAPLAPPAATSSEAAVTLAPVPTPRIPSAMAATARPSAPASLKPSPAPSVPSSPSPPPSAAQSMGLSQSNPFR